jgi:hypothetical protein
MKRTSFALIALTCAVAPAATAENQIWTSVGLAAGPSADGQLGASLDINSRYEPDGELSRLELRPGLTYALKNGVELAGGYYYGHTNQTGEDRNEHRLWQQASYDIGEKWGLEFSGRTRMEQRRREGFDDTGARIRQRLTADYPIEGTPLTLSAGPEIYYELSETDWGAEQGFSELRTEAKLEWAVSETLGLSFGYLNQREIEQDGPDETNHHIVIGLSKDF